jgi:hypothetical protein
VSGRDRLLGQGSARSSRVATAQMDGGYRIERFRSSELHRLHPAEDPPVVGWAIGTGGLFRDGVRIADEAELQVSGPGSVVVRYVPLEA